MTDRTPPKPELVNGWQVYEGVVIICSWCGHQAGEREAAERNGTCPACTRTLNGARRIYPSAFPKQNTYSGPMIGLDHGDGPRWGDVAGRQAIQATRETLGRHLTDEALADVMEEAARLLRGQGPGPPPDWKMSAAVTVTSPAHGGLPSEEVHDFAAWDPAAHPEGLRWLTLVSMLQDFQFRPVVHGDVVRVRLRAVPPGAESSL